MDMETQKGHYFTLHNHLVHTMLVLAWGVRTVSELKLTALKEYVKLHYSSKHGEHYKSYKGDGRRKQASADKALQMSIFKLYPEFKLYYAFEQMWLSYVSRSDGLRDDLFVE